MPKQKYKPEVLEAALNDVRNGVLSKKAAARKYCIPRATIQFRLSSKFNKAERGPPPILIKEEEDLLEKWIIDCSKKGFPRRKEDIQLSVQEFLTQNNRPNPFKNNLPGIGWYQAFLRRHPKITQRTAEAVTAASSCVSEADIKSWFSNIESVLREENMLDILKNPDRIFNGDETNFQLCPKNSKVLAPLGTKNVYEVDKGMAKSAITAMFTFSASGKVVPPMLIYPYQRLPSAIVNSVPDNWGIGHSDNGWMKAELFYEYIANIFNKFLVENNVTLPVILFVDGHKSHLTYQLSTLCTELQIILVALYPNATRILQPADVAAFRPIKAGWKQALMKWRKNHPTEAVTRECVAPLLNEVVQGIKPETLKNGFKACGLYPWKSNAIDFSKCLGKADKGESIKANPTITLEQFKSIVGDEMIDKFENIETVVEINTEPPLFYTLFRVWEEFHRKEEKRSESIGLPVQKANVISDKLFESIPSTSHGSSKEKECLQVNAMDSENCKPKDPISISHFVQLDHCYSTPIKNKENQSYSALTQSVATPTKTNDSTTQSVESSICSENMSSSQSSLAAVLLWPETPKRKGKREIERVPFVVTSKKWKSLFEEKKQKKAEEEKKKAERKSKREENKTNREQQKQHREAIKINKKCASTKYSAKVTMKKLSKPDRRTDRPSKPNEVVKEEHGKKLNMENNVNNLNCLLKNTGNKVKISGLGLCYTCGMNIKEESFECDLCCKVYHKKCLPKDYEFDELDPVFVCASCMEFGDSILKDVNLKD